jgi:hypothetical protein
LDDVILQDGRIAREYSVTLRNEAHNLMERVEMVQKTSHELVNRSLTQKITESKNLKVCCKLLILLFVAVKPSIAK